MERWGHKHESCLNYKPACIYYEPTTAPINSASNKVHFLEVYTKRYHDPTCPGPCTLGLPGAVVGVALVTALSELHSLMV